MRTHNLSIIALIAFTPTGVLPDLCKGGTSDTSGSDPTRNFGLHNREYHPRVGHCYRGCGGDWNYTVADAEEYDDGGFFTALRVANILGRTGQMAVGISALSKVDACREFLSTPVAPTPPDFAPALGPDGFRGSLRPVETGVSK